MLSHIVRVDELDANIRAGRYAALCGAVVLPASLTVAPTGRCGLCDNEWRGTFR